MQMKTLSHMKSIHNLTDEIQEMELSLQQSEQALPFDVVHLKAEVKEFCLQPSTLVSSFLAGAVLNAVVPLLFASKNSESKSTFSSTITTAMLKLTTSAAVGWLLRPKLDPEVKEEPVAR